MMGRHLELELEVTEVPMGWHCSQQASASQLQNKTITSRCCLPGARRCTSSPPLS